jgi:hypothetical protein
VPFLDSRVFLVFGTFQETHEPLEVAEKERLEEYEVLPPFLLVDDVDDPLPPLADANYRVHESRRKTETGRNETLRHAKPLDSNQTMN